MSIEPLEKLFKKDDREKLLSSLIELLYVSKTDPTPRHVAIFVIKNAEPSISYCDQGVYSYIKLTLNLQMENFISQQLFKQKVESLINEQLKTCFPNYEYHYVLICPILRDIGAHKDDYPKKYFQERITSINDYVNSEAFTETSVRTINALESKDYPAAIGGARETLESFMKHITSTDEQQFNKLCANFKMKLLSQNNDTNCEEVINLLDQLILCITKLRNIYGTGHGPSKDKAPIKSYNARLIVETAISIMSYAKELLEYK